MAPIASILETKLNQTKWTAPIASMLGPCCESSGCGGGGGSGLNL
jgi:hypothetical protein